MENGYSKDIRERITGHVMADLDPSWLVTHTKVAVAAVVGGLLSLLICGQFGFGFTQAGDGLNHTLHMALGPVPCAILCGFLFAIFPVLIMRLILCHPLQFRAIMKRRRSAFVVWFGGFGAVMINFGHHGGDVVTFSAWILGAIVAANVLAQMMYALIPTWDLQARLRLLSQA